MKANKTIHGNTEDWLEARRGKIGGSSIVSILGLDRYKTPLQVFFDLTGQSGPSEENKYTIAGHKLEPIVVDYFAEATGAEIDPDSVGDVIYQHPEYDFLIGSPDREYLLDGKRCVLECKTTQYDVDTDSDLFKKWYYQLQWYLMITGCEQGALAWLSSGVDFDYVPVIADKERQAAMLTLALDFWNNHILTGIPPDPVNASDMMKIFREPTGLVSECDELLYRDILQLKREKERLKTQEEVVKSLDERVRLAIGASEEVRYMNTTVATYRFGNRTDVDTKLLKSEYPETYEKVARKSTTRTLRLK